MSYVLCCMLAHVVSIFATHAFLFDYCSVLFGYVGPAGTGKTESVKALGNQLGRFVLVFNCDETFDFQV